MQRLRDAFQLMAVLTDEEWAQVSARINTTRVPKNTPIVREGQVCNEAYFIAEGLVRLYARTADGKEVSRQFFFENSFFSEYQSFLTRLPSKNTADALEETELWWFTHDDIQRFYKQIPAFQVFGRVMAESLFLKISERVNSFLTETPEARYQQLVSSRPKVLQRIPQYMIASYLGITPEHLSRLRKKMAGQ